VTDHEHDERVGRLAAMRERANDARPESWVPREPGEELAGELVRYERGETSYGRQIIAIIRTLDGTERACWLLHAVLLDEFAKAKPRPGELLLIRYEGKRENASGQPYAAYRLEVDREPVAPEWDAIGQEAAAELRGDQGVS
jgi:hypothetical protein